jgi:hexosaminidase
MRRNLPRLCSVLAILAILTGCVTARREAPPPRLSLIPVPASLTPGSGYFEVSANTPVVARGGADADAVADYLGELVEQSRVLRLHRGGAAANGTGAIEFTLDPAFHAGADDHGEGYAIDVTAHGIAVTAATKHGLFDGAVTLWQLMTQESAPATAVRVPALRIVDYPRFAWRGLLLDSARHFQSPAFVKRFIDEMARHKLDVLHWHLTDDQGWRVEIRKYPKLTEIGAWREPQPNEAALVDAKSGKYGGFYTQDEIRDIVRHAAQRCVTIVPEIDMPGHAQAVIASYPQFGVTGRQPPVSSDWGINTWLYNVDEPTFAFIDEVLGEITALFPSPYIHVGGDEAAKDQWQASAHVQERMHRLGVRDEAALQGYFTARLEAMLRKRGRRLVGWDEILDGGLPPGAVVMSWRGSAGAIAAATHGDDVVMAPDPSAYLDHLQGSGRDEPPGRIKVLSLADVYAFDAVPKELTAEQAAHILGAQANLWSEYFTTEARVEYAAFPRAAALAERLWSPAARTGWDDFVARLPAQLERYRTFATHYADSAFAPQASVTSAAKAGRFDVQLARQVDFGAIRYTLDGTPPTPRSNAYAGPMTLAPGTRLHAATFAGDRMLSTARATSVDAMQANRRYSDKLASCTDKLLLRLEGNADGGGAPLYNVDLMNPCWIYPQVDFGAARSIDVRTGALPYFFELWHDAPNVVTHAPSGDADELQVHVDGCDGRLLAAVPLSEARNDQRTVSVATQGVTGKHDVCLYFATRQRDPLRLIDWVEPVAAQ